MKFTPEIGLQILQAIRAKLQLRPIGACAICESRSWELLDSFISLTISPEPQDIRLGGHILPNAVLICKTCGNTHLLNLNVLGLAHLLRPEADVFAQVPEAPKGAPGGLESPETPAAARPSGSSVLSPAPAPKE